MKATFFHDLQCLSGFGDRLIDVSAALAIARLHTPNATLDLCWQPGLTYPGFEGIYDVGLFSMEGCTFRDEPPEACVAVDKAFDPEARADQCLVPMPSGSQQLILRRGAYWGNNAPGSLHQDAAHYGLDARLSLDDFVDAYIDAARTLKPAPCVEESIPADIGERIGVHVRLTDKIVGRQTGEETAIDMSVATWRAIEVKGSFHIDRYIARGEPLFICSDDPSYQAAMAEHIQSRGGNVVQSHANPEYAARPGYTALVDFFALSKTKKVLQMTKYSTYSLFAAVVGNTPFENFYRGEGGAGHRLDIWRCVLDRLDGP